MLEQGPDFWCWFDTTQFSYIPLCSPNTCKYVFNPNVTTFQSNCAKGLNFSAFIDKSSRSAVNFTTCVYIYNRYVYTHSLLFKTYRQYIAVHTRSCIHTIYTTHATAVEVRVQTPVLIGFRPVGCEISLRQI